MLSVAMAVVAAIAAVFFLDVLIGRTMRLTARIWPNDFAGPDGWLVDTQRGAGVFDRG